MTATKMLVGSRQPGFASTSSRPPTQAARTDRATVPAMAVSVWVNSATAVTMSASHGG